VACGIDSISVSPDSFLAVKRHVATAETNRLSPPF
jgi:pyruvate,water dikinase